MREIKIDEKNANQRLDKFLLKYLNNAAKSFVYKMLRKKNIKLNGKKASGNEILAPNDEIKLFLADETIESLRRDIVVKKTISAPDIVYEDENIIIANKPAGLLVQGDKNENDENLNDILLFYLKQKGELSDTFKPGVANRLDRSTGGLVLMGKNLAAAQALAEAMRENKAEKLYICAVKGKVEKRGEISGWHTKNAQNKVLITKERRENAVPVKTLYSPLHTGEKYSILSVKLVTGRSHQIRESLETIGFPIIGDPKYGDPETNRFFKTKFGLKHQLLYAVSIKLTGQDDILKDINEKTFRCRPDKTAEKILNYIKEMPR